MKRKGGENGFESMGSWKEGRIGERERNKNREMKVVLQSKNSLIRPGRFIFKTLVIQNFRAADFISKIRWRYQSSL